MSQNIDSIANVLEMTLSAKILTGQFREIIKRTSFKTILLIYKKNVLYFSEYPLNYFGLVHISENDTDRKQNFIFSAGDFTINENLKCEEFLFKLSP